MMMKTFSLKLKQRRPFLRLRSLVRRIAKRWRDLTFFFGWALITVGIVGDNWRGWTISIGTYIGLGSFLSAVAKRGGIKKQGGESE
jgi:hypothetical protein